MSKLPAVLDVLLLGWAAGQHKHVAVHRKIYEHVTNQPRKIEFMIQLCHGKEFLADFQPHDMKDSFKYLVSRGYVQEKKPFIEPLNRQLVVHLFSNGGIRSLLGLIWLAELQNKHIGPIKGIIVDSAPTIRSLQDFDKFVNVIDNLTNKSYPKVLAPVSWYISWLLLAQMTMKSIVLGQEMKIEKNYRLFTEHED